MLAFLISMGLALGATFELDSPKVDLGTTLFDDEKTSSVELVRTEMTPDVVKIRYTAEYLDRVCVRVIDQCWWPRSCPRCVEWETVTRSKRRTFNIDFTAAPVVNGGEQFFDLEFRRRSLWDATPKTSLSTEERLRIRRSNPVFGAPRYTVSEE